MQREYLSEDLSERYDTGDEDTPSGAGNNGYVKKNNAKRSSLACVRCRRRHVKCPGGDPCAKCAAAKIACEYLEPNKKLIVSMKYLQQLQESLADMKKENVQLQSIVNSLRPGERNAERDELERTASKPSQADIEDEEHKEPAETSEVVSTNLTDEEEIVSNFAQRSGRLVESRTGQRYFVGSSSMTLFGLEIQSLLSKYLSHKKEGDQIPFATDNKTRGTLLKGPQASLGQIDVLQEEGNAYKIVLAKNEGNDDISVNFTLPSYSYAMFLVDTFITYNDGCFYFFNEGIVKYGLKIAYEGGAYYKDRTLQTIWFCKVLLIFAIGEMYLGTSNNINGNKVKDTAKLPGSGFFEEASQIFSCLFSSGRIESVTKEGGIEVMLLYAFYLQVADCTVASYFYFGQALRACLILGMHVDAQRDFLTRFELEHRRRLWWTVYMFERMLSSKAGLPLSFTDNTISTELPGDFDMSNPASGCEHYIFPEAEYIINCVKIVKINAQILNKLYQRQPNTNILAALKSVVRQLLQWRNNLSGFLQVDFTEKTLKISRLCANMFTEYFQGMNLAIRPLLFHFASIQLKKFKGSNTYINLQNYSSTISALLNCSLQASVNTIRSLWALMDQNMVALFGYMDREYLFTASCTLVLFNAAFGIHEQTYEHLDHALNIFTKMRNLGNNPAGLRRSQLLTLMANLDFHGIMRELISFHNDSLKPDTQYDAHNFRNVNIVSQTMTDSSSLSDIINATLGQSAQPNLSKQETQIMEKNSNQFDPLNAADDGDLQTLLEKMSKESHTDNKLWKEISDQAMWLGNTMDPTSAPGNETDFGEGLGLNY
ncbi:PUT3 (YKL015W) [Zygosaccharomyces parabailii]|nr:PUT3 (YKL015W) [Zygosaccharomyces parabailii]CDH18050.1 related to Proline utilization trans-activator [Zygosaccharomyces bailii ISA1307]